MNFSSSLAAENLLKEANNNPVLTFDFFFPSEDYGTFDDTGVVVRHIGYGVVTGEWASVDLYPTSKGEFYKRMKRICLRKIPFEYLMVAISGPTDKYRSQSIFIGAAVEGRSVFSL